MDVREPATPPRLRPVESGVPTAALRSNNAVTALVHLHRAEVGRLTAYRARMDTTTSWAITTSALITTFAYGPANISHAALLFLMLIDYFFLLLEARRFRSYEAIRYRVQFFERSFYPEILGEATNPGWEQELLTALRSPGRTVNPLGAIGWRLRRNYLAIEGAVVLAWVLKLYLSAGPSHSLEAMVAQAVVGAVPGWAVCAAVAGFSLWLAALALLARRRYPFGDDETQAAMHEEPA
jgi:uncharacterized membrane protein